MTSWSIVCKIFNMYRVLVCVTICLAAAWAEDEDLRKCMRLMHPSSKGCCVRDPPVKLKPHNHDGVEECLQLPGKPPACEREICIATKKGYATSDGKIDKDAIKATIEKDFENNEDAKNNIIKNCIEGDLEKYGRSDMCDVMKLKTCIDVQFIMSCPKWDNEGPCTGMKDLVEECMAKFT